MDKHMELLLVIVFALFTSSSALYSEWSPWSACSKSCNGEQNRTRACQTISQQPCGEGITQKRDCNTSGCYPSSEVIITCAVLGALILLFLIVLIIIIIKTRKNNRRITNLKNREFVMDFEKSTGKSGKNNDAMINKNNAQRTLSTTPSTASQVTYLPPTDGTAEETAVQPYGGKECDLY